MKKKIIIGVVIVALIGTMFALHIRSKNKNVITTVNTSKVTMGDVKDYLSTTGTIESTNEQDYSASATTAISKVNVSVGDKVNKGDTLLTYDTSDLSNQVASAQINYNIAISQKQDAVSGNNVSVEKLKQLDDSVALALLNLDSANTKLAQNSSITSSISGVVTAVNVVNGQTGCQGSAFVVQDLSNLELVVQVGKYDAANVALGQAAIISNNGRTYQAKVSKIYPTASVGTSGGNTTLPVNLTILNSAPQLKVNFDANVNILIAQALNVVNVPAQTLLTNKNGSSYLFVVENGKAVQKNVILGVQSDTEAQIVSGVKVGDSVILNPGSTVINGSRVKD